MREIHYFEIFYFKNIPKNNNRASEVLDLDNCGCSGCSSCVVNNVVMVNDI